MEGLSASDVLAMNAGKDSGFLEGNGIIILILFFLIFGMGGGAFGGASNGALTRAELYDGLNTQDIQNSINNLSMGMNNGFNSVNSNIAGIGSQMASCCCEIKTAIHSEGEATRALIQENTIQSLRDEIAAKDRELLTTGLVTAQTIQTNNLENFIRQIIGCNCSN